MLRHRGAFRHSYSDANIDDTKKSASDDKFKAAMNDYSTYFNGPIDSVDVLFHYCKGARCCPGGRRHLGGRSGFEVLLSRGSSFC